MGERRRPLWRRLLLALAVVLALGVALSAGLVWLVNRPAVRARLAAELAGRLEAALHQPVTVGDVRLSFYPPRLHLESVRIGDRERPFLAVDSVQAGLGQIRLADREIVLNQIRAVGVRVGGHLPGMAEGGSAGRSWFGLVVRQLEVEDVTVNDLELPAHVQLSADNVAIRWTGTSRSPIQAAVALIPSFTARVPGIETLRGGVQAWGRRTAGGWEIRRLRGSGQGWKVHASGALADGVLSAKGEATVDLRALDETLHLHTGLGGSVTADWEARIGRGRFRVDTGVSAATVSVAGFVFSDVKGNAHVSPDGIEAEAQHVGFAGGSLKGSYLLEELGPPWSHRIAVRGGGVALAGLLRQIGVGPAGLAATMTTSAELGWNGGRIREGIGTAVVDMTPAEGSVPVAGRATLGLNADGAMSITTEGMRLVGAPVEWEGRLELGSWVPTWSIRGEHVPIPAIATLLAGWLGSPVLPAGLDGETAMDVRLHGPFDRVEVVGDVVAAPVSLGAVSVDAVRGSFELADGVLRFEDGLVSLGAGRARVGGTLDLAHDGALALSLSGRGVPLARVIPWSGLQLPIDGSGGFEGTLAGTLARPTVAVQLRFSEVAVAGIPLGEGSGKALLDNDVLDIPALEIGPFSSRVRLDFPRREAVVHARLQRFGLDGVSPLLARIAGDGLDLELDGAFPFDQPSGRLDVTSAHGARGTVEMDAAGIRIALERPGVWRLDGAVHREGGDHRGELSYAILSLGDLAHDLAGEELPVSGEAHGSADVLIRPHAAPRIEGVVESLTASVSGDSVSLRAPARFSVTGSDFDIPSFALSGPTASLEARVHRGADGSLTAHARGKIPVPLVGLFWRDARLGGNADVTVDVSGTESRPVIVGRADVSNGSILLPEFPAPLTQVTGEIDFVPEAMSLKDVGFAFGGGTGRANGQIILSPSVVLDVSAAVRNVRWPVMAGFTPGVSGDLRVVGPLDSLSLSGDTTLQRTVFHEDINLQRLVLQQLRAPQRALAPEAGGVRLNLRVDVPGTFEVNTPLARVTLRGQVRVVGSSTQPGMLGQLEVAPGGELELSGQRYELERGTLTFSDPNRINPFLDILAHVSVGTVEITVGLLGTVDRLTPTLTSNPPLPETDILALLSTGRRADQATQGQAGALAGSFLTEQLTGAVTRRARALLDVDQLRLDPFAATESGNPTARVTVVKQVSRDWSVTVSTNLASNREEVVESRWRIGQGLYLQASRDIDGSYSLEVKWLHRY